MAMCEEQRETKHSGTHVAYFRNHDKYPSRVRHSKEQGRLQSTHTCQAKRLTKNLTQERSLFLLESHVSIVLFCRFLFLF